MRILLIFLFGLGLGLGTSAQRHYVCYYTPERPVIDGTDGEKVWQKAAWTEDFTDIEGDIRPHPPLRTRAKLLWDTANLYIYAEMQEPDLWSELRQHDTALFKENNFEFFLDADNDTHNYFELEINALGTVMDLFMPKPYRNGGRSLMGWEALGLRSAVRVSGTLNRPGDKDQGWSVEMAVPLQSLRMSGDKRLTDSSMVRFNFSRVEWDRDIVGGKYVPRVDGATGRRLPEHNWVWSPQGIVNMHAPEKWGYLLLTSRPVGGDPVAFVLPAEEKARPYLWEVYDRQTKYRAEHGMYAPDLPTLSLFATVQDATGGLFRLQMEATTKQYTVSLTGSTFPGTLTIDQDGRAAPVRTENK